MGSAMAERLATQGVEVILFNRTAERATALADKIGASVATTPAEAASRADVVITMVADDAAVHDQFDGPDGIAAGIRPADALAEPAGLASTTGGTRFSTVLETTRSGTARAPLLSWLTRSRTFVAGIPSMMPRLLMALLMTGEEMTCLSITIEIG